MGELRAYHFNLDKILDRTHSKIHQECCSLAMKYYSNSLNELNILISKFKNEPETYSALMIKFKDMYDFLHKLISQESESYINICHYQRFLDEENE